MIQPKVTVLMPVYNGEKYLTQAIESILNQTFQDFEFVIVDDGSTDGSRKIIESYQDPRIVFASNKANLKPIATLNHGLKLARGKYIARMDQDDISLPGRLIKQVRFLDKNPKIGIVGTGFRLIDSVGKKGARIYFPSSPKFLSWALCFYCPLAHPSVMMRTGLIRQLGGYTSPELKKRGNYPAEDYDLWRRAQHITELSNLPEILFYLRKHQSNLTDVYRQEHLSDTREISRLAISDIIGKEISQTMVDLLWTSHFKKLGDAALVADLIVELYDSYRLKKSVTFSENRLIRRDVVKRLLSLAYQSGDIKISRKIIKLALKIDIYTGVLLAKGLVSFLLKGASQ